MSRFSLRKLGISALVSLATIPAIAEEQVVTGAFVPAPEAHLINAHTIRYSTEFDLELIPVYATGSYIFMRILGSPLLFSLLDPADRDIILAMPDQFDERFTRPHSERIVEGCYKFLDNPATYSPLAAGIELNETQKFLDDIVGQYYLDALVNQFSESTASLILSLYDQMRGTRVIGYSRLDYAGLSTVLPERVSGTYVSLCHFYMTSPDISRKSLVKDRLPAWGQ
jgi:hypothetical protein